MSARCGSCQAAILWVTTEGGNRMPLDAAPTRDGNVIPLHGRLDPAGRPVAQVLRQGESPPPGIRRFTSHWYTCPRAEEHRGRTEQGPRRASRPPGPPGTTAGAAGQDALFGGTAGTGLAATGGGDAP